VSPHFLADEDLRFEIVLAVRRLEPTLKFETVVERGLSGLDDAAVLEHAKAHGLIVVSHDVNTMKAIAEKRIRDGIGIAGLFLIPQSRGTRSVAESLLAVWAASEASEWADRIVYLPL
jgi:hypothetical protein